MIKTTYYEHLYPSKVGSIPTPNICRYPKRCSICSTRYWKLTPLQKKKILAHIKHDPTKVTPKPNRIRLSSKQIEIIKQNYIKPPKPIYIPPEYYDIFISKEDIAAIDKKINQLHPKAMLIKVPKEEPTEIKTETDNNIASILFSLKKAWIWKTIMNSNHQHLLPNNNNNNERSLLYSINDNSNNAISLLYSINDQQIVYIYVKIEYQSRGTPHAHWIILLQQQQNLPPQ